MYIDRKLDPLLWLSKTYFLQFVLACSLMWISFVAFSITELFKSASMLKMLYSQHDLQSNEVPQELIPTLMDMRSMIEIAIKTAKLYPLDELGGEEALEGRKEILKIMRNFHRLTDLGFVYLWLENESQSGEIFGEQIYFKFPHVRIVNYIQGLGNKLPPFFKRKLLDRFEEAIGMTTSVNHPLTNLTGILTPYQNQLISDTLNQHKLQPPKNSKPKILVLTTSHGGHQFASSAIKKRLEGRVDVNSEIVDVENLIKPGGSIFQSTLKHNSYFDIYYQAFADEDPWVFYQLYSMHNQLLDLYPPNELSYFEEFIKEGDYDLIISTCQHLPYLARMSFIMGVPYWLFGTDVHENWEGDLGVYQRLLTGNSITRGVSTFKLFRHISTTSDIDSLSEDNHVSERMIRSSIPVRPEFYEEASDSEAHDLFESLGLNPEHSFEKNIVLVSMGSFSHSILKQVTQELAESRSNLKKTMIIVIDKNADEEWRSFVYEKTEGRVVVVNFLDDKKMATAMKLARFIVSKPGGSTSAEILTTKSFLLGMFSHLTFENEIKNYDMLEKHGQANIILDVEDLVRILKHAEIDNDFFKAPAYESDIPDWRNVFDTEIEKFLNEYNP